MEWMILAGCVVGSWAVLTMLGNERQRRLDDLREKARVAAEIEKEQARQAQEVPVLKSK